MDALSRRQLLQGSPALGSLGLLAGCGLLPSRAQQPPKIPRLGLLGIDSRQARSLTSALLDGLRQFGYIEGQNIIIEYRFAARDDQFPDLAAELVNLPVDIILSGNIPATRAAKQVSSTIPIVMTGNADPVAAHRLGLTIPQTVLRQATEVIQ